MNGAPLLLGPELAIARIPAPTKRSSGLISSSLSQGLSAVLTLSSRRHRQFAPIDTCAPTSRACGITSLYLCGSISIQKAFELVTLTMKPGTKRWNKQLSYFPARASIKKL